MTAMPSPNEALLKALEAYREMLRNDYTRRFITTFKQAPRGFQHGRYRRTSSQTYSGTTNGADNGAGGSDKDSPFSLSLFADKPEPKPIPHSGIRAGEITGHRAWFVRPDGLSLCSWGHDFTWEPGATIEGAVDKTIRIGFVEDRPLGVYSYKDREQLIHEVYMVCQHFEFRRLPIVLAFWDGPVETLGLVTGTISMWGEVIEHERGYRAQFAKIKTFESAYGGINLLNVCNHYGIEI